MIMEVQAKYTMNVPLKKSQETRDGRKRNFGEAHKTEQTLLLVARAFLWNTAHFLRCFSFFLRPRHNTPTTPDPISSLSKSISQTHFYRFPFSPSHSSPNSSPPHLAFLHQWLLIRRPISLLRRFLHCPVPPSLSFLASSSALFPPLLSLGGPLSHFVLSPLVLMAMDPSSRSVWTIPDLPSPPMVRRRRHRLLISSHCAIGLRYPLNLVMWRWLANEKFWGRGIFLIHIVKNSLNFCFCLILGDYQMNYKVGEWVLLFSWVSGDFGLFGRWEFIFRFFSLLAGEVRFVYVLGEKRGGLRIISIISNNHLAILISL